MTGKDSRKVRGLGRVEGFLAAFLVLALLGSLTRL